MSSLPQSSYESGSDCGDYQCTVCNDVSKRAEFHCESCQKRYCQKCIQHHDDLIFQHFKHGRVCKVHTNLQMDRYCFDHHQPCCSICIVSDHRRCRIEEYIPNSIKPVSRMSEQGETNTFSVQGTSKHNVKIPKDQYHCFITGICVLPDRKMILADWNNKNVKLLDDQYQVVSYIKVATAPYDMCQVASNEAALTVGMHIQFIRVNDKKLTEGRSFLLEKMNESACIAHHQGHLFITSGTALHKFVDENGRWLCKLYEDTSDSRTVWKCVVSPAGDKLYVSQPSLQKLITLDMTGKPLATFSDPGLLRPMGVCVAPEGQIIVCGEGSDTIVQVDSDGKTKLSTLATYGDGLRWPWSVCYTRHTATIIVGQWIDTIMVLKAQTEPDAPIAPKIESPTTRDLQGLFKILQIDVMAECGTDLFPLFRRGCGALQGIVTRGKSILDRPALNQKESHLVNTRSIYVYTTSALMKVLIAACPEQLAPVTYFSPQEPKITFPALLMVDIDQHDNIKKSISSIDEDITSLCVLLVDKEQNTKDILQQDTKDIAKNDTKDIPDKDIFQRSSVLESVTTKSNIMVAADNLLERAIFAVLKNLVEKCYTKYGSPNDMPDIEKKQTLQSIYTYARTAYKRSKVPTLERLTLLERAEITYKYPGNIDEVIKEVLEIKGVIGCSKNIGYLEVLIDNTQDTDETTGKIQQLLVNKDVKCTMSYGKFQKFISHGDRVYDGVHEGTLGGFAQELAINNLENIGEGKLQARKEVQLYAREEKIPASSLDHEHPNLVALISRHVAMHDFDGTTVYLKVNNTIMGARNTIPVEPKVDVFPINVYAGCLNQCNTLFRTDDGRRRLHGHLLQQEEFQNWIGEPVYMWGAKTSPGLGTLAEIMKVGNGLWIKVHDRNEGQKLCKKGDSGAMVCAIDRSEATETLYAIAMVVGELVQELHQQEKVTYFAVVLEDAFRQFQNSYGSAFELCSDDVDMV